MWILVITLYWMGPQGMAPDSRFDWRYHNTSPTIAEKVLRFESEAACRKVGRRIAVDRAYRESLAAPNTIVERVADCAPARPIS